MRTFDHPIVQEHLYNKVINKYYPDIFVSTWEHTGVSQHTEGDHGVSKLSQSIIENNYPNIKGIEIENFDEWLASLPAARRLIWENERIDGRLRATSLPQLYKIYRANKLKFLHEVKTGENYDVVIRYRADLIMVDDFNIESDLAFVYHMNTERFHWSNRIYDIFFYSSSENMNKLCDAWLNYQIIKDHGFNNGLPKLDACRMIYVQALLAGLKEKSLQKNICDVYRYENFEDIKMFLLG